MPGPVSPSTYLLVLVCQQPGIVQVGARGPVTLTPGCYLYVGSARGRLAARLARHCRQGKRLHWHIDYLLASGLLTIREIWVTARHSECALVHHLLAQPTASWPAPRLGASDCRCPAHFLGWQATLADLRRRLSAWGCSPYPCP